MLQDHYLCTQFHHKCLTNKSCSSVHVCFIYLSIFFSVCRHLSLFLRPSLILSPLSSLLFSFLCLLVAFHHFSFFSLVLNLLSILPIFSICFLLLHSIPLFTCSLFLLSLSLSSLCPFCLSPSLTFLTLSCLPPTQHSE